MLIGAETNTFSEFFDDKKKKKCKCYALSSESFSNWKEKENDNQTSEKKYYWNLYIWPFDLNYKFFKC